MNRAEAVFHVQDTCMPLFPIGQDRGSIVHALIASHRGDTRPEIRGTADYENRPVGKENGSSQGRIRPKCA